MGQTQADTVSEVFQADLFVYVCMHKLNDASKDMRSHAPPLPGIDLGVKVLKEVKSTFCGLPKLIQLHGQVDDQRYPRSYFRIANSRNHTERARQP
jgi:hypothetical protein